MPIHPPGERYRYSKLLKRRKSKRGVVAILSLTAMVDMFTVLAIFLLQNYNSTGEIIYIPKEVTLPKAERIKELKPAVVVTISSKEILLDRDTLMTYEQLTAQKENMVQPLLEGVQKALAVAKSKYEEDMQRKLREVVNNARTQPPAANTPEATGVYEWSKVTVQADKGIDFAAVRKVLYTVTEAGAAEINFAVTKESTTN